VPACVDRGHEHERLEQAAAENVVRSRRLSAEEQPGVAHSVHKARIAKRPDGNPAVRYRPTA